MSISNVEVRLYSSNRFNAVALRRAPAAVAITTAPTTATSSVMSTRLRARRRISILDSKRTAPIVDSSPAFRLRCEVAYIGRGGVPAPSHPAVYRGGAVGRFRAVSTEMLQGWRPDPYGRFEERYFSDGIATRLVRTGRIEASDEPEG